MTSLILPSADTAMMNLFLEHVSQTFSPFRNCILERRLVSEAVWKGMLDPLSERFCTSYLVFCSMSFSGGFKTLSTQPLRRIQTYWSSLSKVREGLTAR